MLWGLCPVESLGTATESCDSLVVCTRGWVYHASWDAAYDIFLCDAFFMFLWLIGILVEWEVWVVCDGSFFFKCTGFFFRENGVFNLDVDGNTGQVDFN